MSRQGNTIKGQTCNVFDGRPRYMERCARRWRAACIINMYCYIWRWRTRSGCGGGRHGRNGGAVVYSSMPRRFAHTLLRGAPLVGTGGRMRARGTAAYFRCLVPFLIINKNGVYCVVSFGYNSRVPLTVFLTHTLSSLYFVRAK